MNATINQELLTLMNKALDLEHAAYVQYLSHAELVDGLMAEPIIARLRETAGDEAKHQEVFRTIIGDYLNGVPSMSIAKTHPATTIEEILKQNLAGEKEAVDLYTVILSKLKDHRESMPYEYWFMEHAVRHVIIDEQEHIAELKILLGQRS